MKILIDNGYGIEAPGKHSPDGGLLTLLGGLAGSTGLFVLLDYPLAEERVFHLISVRINYITVFL